MDVKTIVLLVDQHRNTIAPDSEIQRAMHWISSALGMALQDVASQVLTMCVTADIGLELTMPTWMSSLAKSQHVEGPRKP